MFNKNEMAVQGRSGRDTEEGIREKKKNDCRRKRKVIRKLESIVGKQSIQQIGGESRTR